VSTLRPVFWGRIFVLAVAALMCASLASAAVHVPAAGAPGWAIYSVNIDGTGLHRLSDSTSSDTALSAPADDSKLAFVRDGELWVMKPDGSDERQLTFGHNLACSLGTYVGGDVCSYYYGWSGDGRKIIAATCSQPDCTGLFGYEIIDVATGRTIPLPQRGYGLPSLSPDGSRFVYGAAIGRVGVPGLRPLKTAHPSTTPVWAPRGDWIGYLGMCHGRKGVCVVRPDGKAKSLARTPISYGQQCPDKCLATPMWAPHADELLFERYDVRDRSGKVDLYSVGVNGRSRVTRLTRSPGIPSFTDVGPAPVVAWSRSGRELALLVAASLEIVRHDARSQRLVVNLASKFDNFYGLAFSPNGRQIIFDAHARLG
jgi:Tol biopolymer transport system component